MPFLKKIIVHILTIEARLILAKYKPTVIAVTGSVGKTSTKDAIFSVLKNAGGYVRKADKSLNSDIGLPLTIIGIPNAWKSLRGWMNNILSGVRLIVRKSEYPDVLILEVGADHPGDIKRVAKWLQPHIVVITHIGTTPVHVEFFKSPTEVFEEKASLALGMREGGTLILFADEPKVLTIADMVKDKKASILSFGTNSEANIRGSENITTFENNAPTGTSFKLEIDGASEQVSVKGIIGGTYMYPILAAAAVAKARNIPLSHIAKSLSEYDAPNGRMRIIPGIRNSTIIDDTYNSSPDAVVSALNTLRGLKTSGVKMVVLGDMMELGKYSAEEHRKVGGQIVGAAKELITIGPRASVGIADQALKSGMPIGAVHSFDTSDEAIPRLSSLVRSGDIVLVKGSQSTRMERIVKALMREPERAGELLVRQEKEWLDKK